MKRLLVSLALLALSACGVNPFKDAETTQQKGYATYGTFVILEEQAAALFLDPAVPPEVKQRLQEADREAKPIADQLHDALLKNTPEEQIASLITSLGPLLIKLTYKPNPVKVEK